MAKQCVVCNLPYPKQCDMCSGSPSLMDYMYHEKTEPEAMCVPVECKKIDIGSGEDVCLA